MRKVVLVYIVVQLILSGLHFYGFLETILKNQQKIQSTLIRIAFNIMKHKKKNKNDWFWDEDIVKSLMF